MKVFLSHSTKDKEFVERLAAALKSAAFEPWLCEVDIEKNENFVAEIEVGLVQCDISLVIWSPDAAASVWTKEEWTSVLARQVAEQRIRLGIVLLRDCALPELLRTKHYIDARVDQEAGLRETVEWLKRRESTQRLSGQKAPVYLPDYRPKDFVGREEYLGAGCASGSPCWYSMMFGLATSSSLSRVRRAPCCTPRGKRRCRGSLRSKAWR